MVKTIEKAYQTSDGKLFTKMDEAVKHESDNVREESLKKFVKYHFPGMSDPTLDMIVSLLKDPNFRKDLADIFSPTFVLGKV